MSKQNMEKSGIMHLPESSHYKGPPREIPQMKDGHSGSGLQTTPSNQESYLEMLKIYLLDAEKYCDLSIDSFGGRYYFVYPKDLSLMTEEEAERVVDYLTTQKD